MLATMTTQRGNSTPQIIRHSSGPKAMSVALDKITRPIFARRGFAISGMINDWEAIVGPHLARHTCPERIIYRRGERANGVLHLRIDNSALALQIQHLEPQILERINGYFGYKAVAGLRMVHGPLPKKTAEKPYQMRPLAVPEEKRLQQSIARVEDDDLKAALERLGRAVAARQNKASD